MCYVWLQIESSESILCDDAAPITCNSAEWRTRTFKEDV